MLLSRLNRHPLRWVRGNSSLTVGKEPVPFLDANVTFEKPIFPPFQGFAADPNASYATRQESVPTNLQARSFPRPRVLSALSASPVRHCHHRLPPLLGPFRPLCIASITTARSAASGSRKTGSAQRLPTCVDLLRGQDNRALSAYDRDRVLACDRRRITRNYHCAH